MILYDKIKEMIPSFTDDGSKEVANQWLELIESEKDMQGLMLNQGFKKILSNMRSDFHGRMEVLVAADPELMAIKKMFIRTIGAKGAEEAISKLVDDYLDESIEVSE